jgi:UDP-glucose 4-epimerase
VVAIFTGQMLTGKQVIINGDGEQTRDFVYVGDCAQANLLALQTPHTPSIFNLGFGKPTSINEIFHTLKHITAYPEDAKYGSAKLGETRHIYLEAKKAFTVFGWQPTLTLEQGLERTVDYFRAQERLS